mgnify:FL=1
MSLLQNGRIKTCSLHRIELHTAQTKSFGGKALAVTNGRPVLRLVQTAKTAQSAQAQE